MLLEGRLVVNVGLPDELGLVEFGLRNGELEDAAGAFLLLQRGLELGQARPGLARVRAPGEPLLVEEAAAINVAELQLEFNVGEVDALRGAGAERMAKDLARRLEVALADLKVRVERPGAHKGPALVRERADEQRVDGTRTLGGTRHTLLPERVVVPEVYVALPRDLLHGRPVGGGEGALVELADAVRVAVRLLETQIVEPEVVVAPVGREQLLVLEAALADDDVLNRIAITVNLLERNELCEQRLGLRLGDAVEGELVDGARTLSLLVARLELRKGDEEIGLQLRGLLEGFDRLLVDGTGTGDIALLLLGEGKEGRGGRREGREGRREGRAPRTWPT